MPRQAEGSSYYNTTHLSGPILSAAQRRAKSQEEQILGYFKEYPKRQFTPSEIHKRLFDPILTPLTSVRRSITDLTAAGHLIKTDIKITGPYGMPEHTWYYPGQKEKPAEQLGLFG
jgi:hypothetical protein